MNKELLIQIDTAIKYIWMYDIKQDYDNDYLLKEDALKNALYFHLRNKLSSLLDQYNLRIYTEFNTDVFRSTGYRPDMIIAQIKDEPEGFLGDCIEDYACVIEIKFKGSFQGAETILKDYEKIKYYIENLNIDCNYYIATIWENEDNATSWIRKNAAWAKDKLTELNASYENDEMRFYIFEHK